MTYLFNAIFWKKKQHITTIHTENPHILLIKDFSSLCFSSQKVPQLNCTLAEMKVSLILINFAILPIYIFQMVGL